MSLIDRPPETNSLMECGRCMRLVHPSCETDYGVEGVIRSVITSHMGVCCRCRATGQILEASYTMYIMTTTIKMQCYWLLATFLNLSGGSAPM